MFCPKCGTQNPDGSQFCGSCGTPFTHAPKPGPVPGAAPSPTSAPSFGPTPAPAYAPAPTYAPAAGFHGLTTFSIISLVAIVASGVFLLLPCIDLNLSSLGASEAQIASSLALPIPAVSAAVH